MTANPDLNHHHSTFGDFLEGVDPALLSICEALRRSITELHPNHVEVVWRRQGVASYGIGPKKLSEHYACIAPQALHVRVGFYRGAFLNDPACLLEGDGTKSRHVKITHAELAESPELKSLIRQAISERLASRG